MKIITHRFFFTIFITFSSTFIFNMEEENKLNITKLTQQNCSFISSEEIQNKGTNTIIHSFGKPSMEYENIDLLYKMNILKQNKDLDILKKINDITGLLIQKITCPYCNKQIRCSKTYVLEHLKNNKNCKIEKLFKSLLNKSSEITNLLTPNSINYFSKITNTKTLSMIKSNYYSLFIYSISQKSNGNNYINCNECIKNNCPNCKVKIDATNIFYHASRYHNENQFLIRNSLLSEANKLAKKLIRPEQIEEYDLMYKELMSETSTTESERNLEENNIDHKDPFYILFNEEEEEERQYDDWFNSVQLQY